LPWLRVELLSSKGLMLDIFLFSAPSKNLRKKTINPFVKNKMFVWHEAHKYIGDSPMLSCSHLFGAMNFSAKVKMTWASKHD